MAAKKVEIKAGADVHLVHAKGHHVPAKVTKVKGGDRQLIDLEADLNGETLVITSSPLDEAGKAADSWHLPEPDAKAEAPKA